MKFKLKDNQDNQDLDVSRLEVGTTFEYECEYFEKEKPQIYMVVTHTPFQDFVMSAVHLNGSSVGRTNKFTKGAKVRLIKIGPIEYERI